MLHLQIAPDPDQYPGAVALLVQKHLLTSTKVQKYLLTGTKVQILTGKCVCIQLTVFMLENRMLTCANVY